MKAPVDRWFLDNLTCPIDRTALRDDRGDLACAGGHRFPVEDGVPVMLREDVPQTISLADASLRRAKGQLRDERAPDLYLESLGISEDEKRGVLELAAHGAGIDPVIAYLVAATNGLTYKHLIGGLTSYPIPEISLPAGHGRRLLDIGCSWGRWSVAAARKGYQAIGIDPSLGAVMAARRLARRLGIDNRYVVADARYLPFPDRSFDATYSYSVLQHMAPDDASAAIAEMGRVLSRGGVARVQMPTRFGIRCLYHQARRGFRQPAGFEVRYWTIPALRTVFGNAIGPAAVDVDCYFGIGLQASDVALLPPRMRRVVRASERLKQASRSLRPLVWAADSVFVEAVRS
jgi:SAM-dependent methyltransferase/uncharacterized protein YbaR (Trm112 family)